MNDRVVEFRIGVLVLATFIVGGILVLLFKEQKPFFQGSYTLSIRLPDARGISEGTPIRKRGIIIGRVKEVQLDKEGTGVVVTAEIDAGREIYRDEVCELRQSLLGDAELEIVPAVRQPTAQPSGERT